MWCDLNWIVFCVGVIRVSKNIQFWYVTIERWWYEKANMKKICSEIVFSNYHSKGWPLMEPKVALSKQALIYHHDYN
jgi:hypothetical protein